jgi:hypothetical protein
MSLKPSFRDAVGVNPILDQLDEVTLYVTDDDGRTHLLEKGKASGRKPRKIEPRRRTRAAADGMDAHR